MPIDYSLGGAIAFVHGNRDDRRCRQIATSGDGVRGATYLGHYFAPKCLLPTTKPLTLMVPQHALRSFTCGLVMMTAHAPFPLGADVAVIVILV